MSDIIEKKNTFLLTTASPIENQAVEIALNNSNANESVFIL